MPTPRIPLARALLGALALALAALLPACGGGGGGSGVPPPPPPQTCSGGTGPIITIQGNVRYTRLITSNNGLGPGLETRPSRYIDVEIHSADGLTCFGRTSTDASGDYSILVTPDAGTQLQVAVFSRTLADPTHDLTVHEADPPPFNSHSPNDVFSYRSPSFTAGNQTVDLVVPYGSDPVSRPSIGFGVLDTLAGQADGVQAAIGTLLPALHAYTRIGNNAAIFNTSFYSHGARAIALLGGAAGLPDNSDTDYFDESIVAHEFHHFVDRTISHSWSRGGAHSGQDLEPGFAWSEGLATGFAQLLLGTGRYMDSSGTNSALPGSVLFTMDIENATLFDNNGIGDEFSMAEILWDLGDDATAQGDNDSDGVNVPLADLFAAIDTFDPAVDGPYLGLFLTRLVGLSGSITTGAMTSFLDGTTGPENQQFTFPPAGGDVFPTAIAIGGMHGATVSSIPTGPGSPNPCRQRASSHWYHLTVPVAGTITLDLQITGIGGSGNDLDLYLHLNTDAFFPVAESTGNGTSETITRFFPAGTYLVRVEADCTSDNEASYTLSVN